MYINKNDQVVEFDVDDTLIIWDHPNSNANLDGIPCLIHSKHVDAIKKFKARGQYVIVWSDGGWEWALTVVRLCQLENYVDEIRCKSKWHFDDKDHSKWNTIRCYHSIPGGPQIDLTESNKK